MLRKLHSAQNFACVIPAISSGSVSPYVDMLAVSLNKLWRFVCMIRALQGPVRLNFSRAMIEKTLQSMSGSFSMLFSRQSHTASENRVELISPARRLARTDQIRAAAGLFFFRERRRARPPLWKTRWIKEISLGLFVIRGQNVSVD